MGWIVGAVAATFLFLGYLGVPLLPLVVLTLIIAAVTFFSSTSGGRLGVGKKETIQTNESVPNLTFDEIGGQKRAKNELIEALDFLIHRDHIDAYGIRPLKGILLSGPPGTGKTLMAKAAAHYTDSVFVSTAGSAFIEMYVGVGAKRIRKLFTEAREMARKKKKKNAIIFIDEIDVIGGRRDGSQHREYDQTLNQLLTEMDGLSSEQDVRLLVVAATNRKDMLDSALLRPGRFDRHITVDLPDKKARTHILHLHLHTKPLSADVKIEKIAEETFGFSGAQLESVANEAAIYALRDEEREITQHHLSLAIDKVMMGEKTDREATQEERERVAIHEMGHAIVAEFVQPESVAQVALSPRGEALGYVRHHPGSDRYLYTREQIEGQIMILLAGAAAEQVVFGNRSTGARNDYERANQSAQLLIESGLSELGIINPDWIEKSSLQAEASRILSSLEERTIHQIEQHRHVLERGLYLLLKDEVLQGDHFRQLLAQADEWVR
ncbi:AAA family ATPase [Mechercharimyces sp. CAU 1602]|nr:AAA family ATPase [Mechercharimyces sp. CAU 1602]MCS1351032.1 AAA family ATPase [Mechercharimyces sp. CAU 1602]